MNDLMTPNQDEGLNNILRSISEYNGYEQLTDLANDRGIPSELPLSMRQLMALLSHADAFPGLYHRQNREHLVEMYFLIKGEVPWRWIPYIRELEKVVDSGKWYPDDQG